MQLLSELASALASAVPVAQEFYLFCFFCLGFVLFRTQTARQLLSLGVGGNAKRKDAEGGIQQAQPAGPAGAAWRTVEELRCDYEQRRYDQVLEGWASLEKYTGEALALVVSALVALRRPEDVGLFVAKVTANLPHLRPSLHEVVDALAGSVDEVPRPFNAAALRDLCDKALDMLDTQAARSLSAALARLNDEHRVGALLRAQALKGAGASAQGLASLVRGFLLCRNLDAALGYLQQALLSVPQTPAAAQAVREATVATVRAATSAASESGVVLRDDDDEDDLVSGAREAQAAPSSRPRAWDVLELLEGALGGAAQADGALCPASDLVPAEALALLLEWAGRCMEPDLAAAARAEKLLRSLSGPGASLSPGALDALVRVHASASGDQAKALACFDDLAASSCDGRVPSEGSLVGMLSACVESKNAELAEHILAWTRAHKRCSCPVFSAAMKVLAAAKLPERILEVYQEAEGGAGLELDQAAYGQVIRCAVQAGQTTLARRLYQRAHNPDTQNSVSLIRACGQEGDVAQAIDILSELHDRGEADTTAFNAALDVAVTAGSQKAITQIFGEMKAARRVDVVSFNILLKQHMGANASVGKAEVILREMAEYGLRPNVATFNSLIGCALGAGQFDQAWRIVDEMERGPQGIDAYTLSILFKGYKGRRRVMDAATFDRALGLLETYAVRVDEVLVNVALDACVNLRDPARLSATLGALRRSGWTIPKQCTAHTYAMLIKAYGMTRQLDMAWKLWTDATSKKGFVPTEQLYSQMIDVLVSNGCLEDARALFEEMKATHGSQSMSSQGFAMAYAMIIRGYAQRKECACALQCYEEMKEKHIKVGLVIFNTLVDACSRIGDVDGAFQLYRDMTDADCVPDLITYSTLIKGYCVSGELHKALELFARMQGKGIQPDAIVFNSLLDGCAKKQMLERCEQILQDMEVAGVTPSNHSASILIKLHGRRRDVDSAFQVFEEMPRKFGFRPNAAVFTCLMSTCITNGRLDLALDLRLRMAREGQALDERTYSTLFRGVLRAGNAEACATLLHEALEQPRGGRRLLDEELAQSSLSLLQRKRLWEEHGEELFERLCRSGFAVRRPGSPGPQGGDGSAAAGAAMGERRSFGGFGQRGCQQQSPQQNRRRSGM